MALGRNERTDGSRRTPSSYCSTPVFIFFVALGLVGVWMITSSNVVPLQEFSQDAKPNEADTPADKMKGNAKIDVPQHQTNSDVPGNQNISHKTTQDTNKKDVEEKLEKESPDNKSKIDNENDGDGKGQDGDSNMGDEDSNTDNGQINMEGGETNTNRLAESEESSNERKQGDQVEGQLKENVSENQDKQSESSGDDTGLQTEILNETTTQNGAWPTQSVESKNENEVQQSSGNKSKVYGYSWKVCNVTAGPDYIPCLDNWAAIKRLPTTKHYEHRERHCPEQGPTCLVSLPQGYRQPIKWPQSRDKVWYFNVPHPKLAEIKGHQNWVKVSGEYLTFPGGGTQFKRGAPHYIEFIEEIMPDIGWGKRTRVVLDVGCGVASFGGHLLDKDVLTMSLAPKDEHEAQVQFALERGIPAILAVMGTKRLPFPGRVFDLIHCARCRVPWHIDGGQLLLELNRLLRPGGYFVWSATPIYKKSEEDVGIWQAMSRLTKKMCWELVMIRKDTVNSVGIAIYRKPSSNECYEKRQENEPPLCQESDDPNAAWNVLLQACMHKVPVDASERGSQWPEQWAVRLEKPPYWLENSQLGVYGKAAPEDFLADYQHWKRIVTNSYLNGMGISWSSVRDVMDMRSVYGGFAAALKDLKVWVMNVVPIDSPDTLPIIYERGLFGIYHDWCESFNTYPRSYDLLHVDHLFSKLKKRCNLVGVIAEVDRILRPEGKLIIRDNAEIISELENMAKSLHWEIRLTYTKDKEGFLCVQKTLWRPKEVETIVSAIA